VLIRSWNVFHGNAKPPARRAFLQEMVRLASADVPDVLCLQELPVWALPRLQSWSGMRAFGAVAARPLPGHAGLGGAVTELHHGLFRSALTGQANAILIAPTLRPVATASIVLNPRDVRRAQARKLALERGVRLAWAKERRVCHAVRVDAGGRFLTVANLHASSVRDRRCQDAELIRAATFADSFAHPDDVLVLAGDFNVVRETSTALEALASPDWGFDEPIQGLDQILVRGAAATRPEPWPENRRRVDGRLLSDHWPIERRIE